VRRDVREVNFISQELLFVRHEWIRVILAKFSAYMHWFIEGGVHAHVTILVDVDIFILAGALRKPSRIDVQAFLVQDQLEGC
jgi:hypothetical protein